MKTKRVFLWTVPRSCSSAFERSILTLPNIHLKSEPFSNAYYFGAERQSRRYESQEADPNLRYEDVAKSIADQTADDDIELVFVKDMAYYMAGNLHVLEEFFKDAKHSFLIRDPKKTIRSLYRASENAEIRASGWEYFDPTGAGFRQLNELYKFVKQNLDPSPLVVDADDLLESPNKMMKAYCEGVGIKYEDHMTTWEPGVMPEPWKDNWSLAWRRGALNSSGFVKASRPGGSPSVPDVTLPTDITSLIEESRPFYEEMYSARIRLM